MSAEHPHADAVLCLQKLTHGSSYKSCNLLADPFYETVATEALDITDSNTICTQAQRHATSVHIQEDKSQDDTHKHAKSHLQLSLISCCKCCLADMLSLHKSNELCCDSFAGPSLLLKRWSARGEALKIPITAYKYSTPIVEKSALCRQPPELSCKLPLPASSVCSYELRSASSGLTLRFHILTSKMPTSAVAFPLF